MEAAVHQTPPRIGSSVIPIINRLQDIFAPLSCSSEIQLPQVVVVGSQSSGKSSVLEALVGRDFLPRGPDICTRRPLVLQLEKRLEENDAGSEWGEFLHLPGKRFYDFAAIRREIQAETEKGAGANKGVSDKKIRLKIFSPNVLNITLVDLPGITKVPVGDQPNDIEARIRTMIMSYIKQESCIILAVSPANSDLATSDALQMARNADPIGSRTIGVITKLDIMDRGTDACKFLLGKVVPLRLGYIGVINRSQEDINQDRSIAEALAYEENFFRNRPVYNGLMDLCGIPQLAKKLNLILEQHIRTVLPSLKAEVKAQLDAVDKKLTTYGQLVESKVEQGAVLLNILTNYSQAFSSFVDGTYQDLSTKELIGGARINYIFQSLVKRLEEVNPCDDLTDEDIRTALQNATGPRVALFVPEVPFDVLVRRQIARLLGPSLDCLQYVYYEMINISRVCEENEMERFPVLRRRADEVIGRFLHDSRKPAEKMIENFIEIETDFINTSHPKFIGGSQAVEIAIQQLRSSEILANASTELKEAMDFDKSTTHDNGQKSLSSLTKLVGNGHLSDQEVRPLPSSDRPLSAGNSMGRSWGISSIFGKGASEISGTKSTSEAVHGVQHTPIIKLKEPPALIRSSTEDTEHNAIEIVVTKLLIASYYDIVRKNTQDFVPKTIMHFLVNNTKRNLLATFIQKLYREDLFDELLQEQEEVSNQRKHAREMHQVLQQALQTLEDIQLEVASRSSSFYSGIEAGTGFPMIPGRTSPCHSTTNANITSFFR